MLGRYSFHLIFVLTLVLASIITTYFTYTETISSKMQALEKNEIFRIKQRMHELQGTIDDLIRKKNFDSIQLEISRLASDPTLNYIYVLSKDRTIVYSTDFSQIGKDINNIELSNINASLEKYKKYKFGFTDIDNIHGTEHIDSVYPIYDFSKKPLKDEKLSGALLISSFNLYKKREEVRYELQEEIFVLLSGYLALIFFVAFVLYFNIKERTKKIIDSIKAYAQGDYSARIDMKGKDELGYIGDSIDSMAEDIQEQYKRVQGSQKQLQQYLDIAKVFIVVVDIKGKISLINKEGLRLLVKEEREVLNHDFLDLIYLSKEKEKMKIAQEELFSNTFTSEDVIELVLVSEDQPIGIVSWSFATIIENEKVVGYIASGVDISKQKEARDELYQLAHFDSLTKLSNRSHLLKQLTSTLENLTEDQSVTLLYIDLDRFKVINDTMGHQVGDEMLQVTGARLKNLLKEEDLISRLGGDEFVVLIKNEISRDELDLVIKRILDSLSTSMLLEGHSISTTASIGVAISPEHTSEADKLLQFADIAMYEAKTRGKNTYYVYESHNKTEMLKKLSLQDDLSHALENGEIIIYYQAQYSSLNNKRIGLEALVRWKHPQKGFIGPEVFIPMAEESGVMLDLGEYILRHSCKEFKEFVGENPSKLVLAVNISAIQFNNKDFISSLKDAMQYSGIRGDELELEITEGILLNDIEKKIELLREIRDIGLKVSIDDFGTGYSSLSYLKRLPITKLKIDQSFMQDITFDSDDQAIVKMIISMAESMHLDVIAEGVETQEQVDFLKERACFNIQGYYYAKPVPIRSLKDEK